MKRASESFLKSVLNSRAASIKPKSSPNGRRVGSDDFKAIKSRESDGGNTDKKEAQQYTGDVIIGIATMHKSNAVPILNKTQAIEVAKMRRN